MDPASELARQIAEIFMSPMQQVGQAGNQALQYGSRLKDMLMNMMPGPQQPQAPLPPAQAYQMQRQGERGLYR